MKKTKTKRSKKPELAGTKVKLTFKKHFLPPLAGLVVAALIFGFFNSQLLSGRIAYLLNSDSIDVVAADNNITQTPIDPNAPPRIIINKINVTAPVIFDQTTINEAAFQKALRDGVVHYPNTAIPGQQGNVVIFGHSSGQWWAPGNYKFIFTLLDKVAVNDRIFVEYKGVRYIYRVNNTSVVEPNDLSVLNQSGNNTLTLITCSPVGTSSKRLIVKAQQIVPKPAGSATAAQAAKPSEENTSNQLPSSSSSFWSDFKELLNL